MSTKQILFFLLIYLLSTSVYGFSNSGNNLMRGSGRITGFVLEQETSFPIEYALITAFNEFETYVTTSGPGGVYYISDVEEGYYTMTCEAIGYETQSAYDVYVNGQGTEVVDFNLTRLPGQITLFPNKDALIEYCNPNSNYGDSEYFVAYGGDNGRAHCAARSLIEFGLSGIPQYAIVINAVLTLYGINHQGDNEAVLQRITEPWAEYGVSWNNQPATTENHKINLPASSTTDQDYIIDVTWFVQKWHEKEFDNNGLFLRLVEESDPYVWISFGSSDYTDPDFHPELVIQYSFPDPPQPNAEDEDKNWIQTTVFDENNNTIGQSRTYYDAFGKETQSQVKSLSDNNVLASQIVCDAMGRPVLTTLPAPIDQNYLGYKQKFISNPSDENYSYVDFDQATTLNDPLPVNENCSLGSYYSDNNTEEPYVHASGFPYARIEYNKLQPGSLRRASLASEQLRMGQGHETQSYTLSATIDELPGYDNEILYNNYDKLIKNVAVDANGVEGVSFYDPAGNILATCMSGNDEDPNLQPIGFDLYFTANIENPFIDIFITKGNNSFVLHADQSGRLLKVYNLATDELVIEAVTVIGVNGFNIDPGFYRVVIEGVLDEVEVTQIKINHSAYYYNFSYYYYDKSGKLIKEIPPIGSCNDYLKTEYEYNALGWLLSSTTPDAGYTEYLYRQDGRIRFSQNALQREYGTGRFSYTNYDKAGRIVEVGEYYDDSQDHYIFHHQYGQQVPNSVFEIMENIHSFNNPDADGLNDDFCYNKSFTMYDLADSYLETLIQLSEKYRRQRFLQGRVSKTWNNEVTTWYSYDDHGRVEWMVQYFPDLEYKTICYEYDFNGSVTSVIYQEDDQDEIFEHIYTYDADKRLKEVHTKRFDGENFDERKQAEYHYYMHGPVKRIELSETQYGCLQGIDYIYNINGWLKNINSPLLDNIPQNGTPNDPGQDYNDVFGMSLDYYYQDYERSNTYVNYGLANDDLFNGNIRSMRWKIPDQITSMQLPEPKENHEWAYTFEYDKRNWLTSALFGVYEHDFQKNYQLPNDVNRPPGDYSPNFTPSEGYGVGVSYDANGNINSLLRNGDEIEPDMDNLTYQYDWINPENPDDGIKSNRLYHLNDMVQNSGYDDDLEDQGAFNKTNIPENNNYRYDAIGQMTADMLEGRHYTYDVYGLVTGIYHDAAHTMPYARYYYDDKGFRYKKVVYLASADVMTYYVCDASGNIISIYEASVPPGGNPEGGLTPIETPIYGSSRIGCYDADSRSYQYEVTDHLGNLRALVRWDELNHEAEILNHSDYYPYGSLMPGRLMVSDNYRFGYQGQFAEKDDETGFNHFELRDYESRLGRWMNTDPAGQYWSSYIGMGNSPVSGIDPDGGYFGWNQAIGMGIGMAAGYGVGLAAGKEGNELIPYVIIGAAAGIGASYIPFGSIFGKGENYVFLYKPGRRIALNADIRSVIHVLSRPTIRLYSHSELFFLKSATKLRN